MTQSALVKKLRVQSGQQVLVLNPPSGYIQSLGELPEGVELSHKPESKYDFVHVFVKDSDEFEMLIQAAIEAVEYDGLLWISYPKRSSKVPTDLSRDVLWEMMEDTGLRPVAQISIDAVWSALRFRPAAQVGK